MLTEEEQRFIDFWENNRDRLKKFSSQWKMGLPLGLTLAAAISLSLMTGWYKRASSVLNTNPSVILVLIAALLLIILFISVFSAQYRWEMNEQRYRELMARKDH
jgi:membrane protein YdbS with pleckstrin-like domain